MKLNIFQRKMTEPSLYNVSFVHLYNVQKKNFQCLDSDKTGRCDPQSREKGTNSMMAHMLEISK